MNCFWLASWCDIVAKSLLLKSKILFRSPRSFSLMLSIIIHSGSSEGPDLELKGATSTFSVHYSDHLTSFKCPLWYYYVPLSNSCQCLLLQFQRVLISTTESGENQDTGYYQRIFLT